MKNKNVNFTKERLEMLLSHYNIKAPTFAKQIGVLYKRLLDIQNEKVKNISGELANKIVSTFPEISLSWLLTGEGDMLVANYNESTIINNSGGNTSNEKDYLEIIKQKDKLIEQQARIIEKLTK